MTKTLLCSGLIVLMILSCGYVAYSQCRLLQEGTFAPQNKKIKLVTRPGETGSSNKVIFFKTSLRVNTDGAPNSYHPQDLTGTQRAINNICNGVGVYRIGRNGRRIKLPCQEARRIFAQFRDSNWSVPSGYRINWQNVIAPKTENGRVVPCVFQTGEFGGYFGSLTSLRNGLTGAHAGECGYKNQLDQRFISAFVLPGGQNVVKAFGADVGDLLVAYNPRNNIVTLAIIGDTGPVDKLGEGSVGLNMALLGRTEQPMTYRDALRLDTGNNEMLIAIIPNSRNFTPQKPFTRENIAERIQNWISQAQFGSQQNFVDFMKACD